VAAGLARHVGIDPLLLRIAFVVVPLALLPYLLAWILLPTDGEGEGSEGGGAAVLVGTGLVVLGGFLALEQADPGWLDLDGRWIAPILLGLTGLALTRAASATDVVRVVEWEAIRRPSSRERCSP
jgi:PspC domain